MSLKAFHLVFVVASVALCLVFSAWGFSDFRQGGETSGLVWGVLGLLGAVGLVVYGRYFLRKLRHISYL